MRLVSALVVILGLGLFMALPFVLSIGSVVFLPLVTAIVLTIILSPLAEGGNQLVAEEGLKLGARLVAPLPFARELYAQDFADLGARARFGALCDRAQVIELPFMFRDSEHVYKVVDGPLAKEIYAGDEQKKMKVIDTWENGFRNITNNVRPIEKPEDMKGVKIRVMENKMYIEMFKALGANPTPMARGELFTGLQTRVIDGQENPLGQIYTSRFYEVQKYATLSGHTYSPEVVVFSLATWKKIPAKYQEEILKASAEAKKFNRDLSAKMDKEYVGKLKEKGMTVTALTAQQIVPFQEKMMPVWDMFADKIGKDLIQKIKDTK